MTRRAKSLFPEARTEQDSISNDLQKDKGMQSETPKTKFEIAKELGIPLSDGDNGDLTSRQAGKIGGPIGGNMVKDMIRLAQEQLARDRRPLE